MKNDKTDKVEFGADYLDLGPDTNESKILIQAAVDNGDIPALTEAEAIYNEDCWYLKMAEKFMDTDRRLSQAFYLYSTYNPAQLKRLLVVKTTPEVMEVEEDVKPEVKVAKKATKKAVVKK